jgi:hypothetical protein
MRFRMYAVGSEYHISFGTLSNRLTLDPADRLKFVFLIVNWMLKVGL